MNLRREYKRKNLEEKINRFGADSLSDYELFLTILTCFISIEKGSKIVEDYLNQYQDLPKIRYFSENTWKLFFENSSDIASMKAICEFSKRYMKSPKLILGQISSSKIIGEYMIKRLKDKKQENLLCVLLDTKNQVLAEKTIFIGTLNNATVHPREIFHNALRYSAARIMIVHNHPSGDVEPSKSDILLTKRLCKCGELLGIELLDHIIVGNRTYLSMREESIIDN